MVLPSDAVRSRAFHARRALVLAHFRSFSASPAVCGPPNGCGGCDLRAWVPPTRYRAIRQGTKPGKVVLLAGASLPLGLLAGVRSRGLARTAVGASDPPTPTRPQGSSGRVASSATRASGPPAASRRGPSGAGVSSAPTGPPAGALNPPTALEAYALPRPPGTQIPASPNQRGQRGFRRPRLGLRGGGVLDLFCGAEATQSRGLPRTNVPSEMWFEPCGARFAKSWLWSMLSPEWRMGLVASLQTAPRGPRKVPYRVCDGPNRYTVQLGQVLPVRAWERAWAQAWVPYLTAFCYFCVGEGCRFALVGPDWPICSFR